MNFIRKSDCFIKNYDDYIKYYKESIEEPNKFWDKIGKEYIIWNKLYDEVYKEDNWFVNGKLNVCYNVLDKHLLTIPNKTALICEKDNGTSIYYTYKELHIEVCKVANLLKEIGINKNNAITIYLPNIPESIISILACARLGIPHNVVFAGFSAASLKEKIIDSNSHILVTCDNFYRGGRLVDLTKNVEQAIEGTDIKKVILVGSYRENNKYINYEENVKRRSDICHCVTVDSNVPLFYLYTSGSTGKPKGIVHSSAGYLSYVALTMHICFDLNKDDIFFSTADIAWIVGHSFILYGALYHGSTTILFQSTPLFPSYDRYFKTIEKHKATIFFTPPTSIKMLMQYDTEYINNIDLKSLRIIGCSGEPINSKTWEWYNKYIGKNKLPIIDTYWQTETSSIILSSMAGITNSFPEACAYPMVGIDCIIKNKELYITNSWPGLAKTILNDHTRFINTYFKDNMYVTGDECYINNNLYYIVGRTDDIIKVSGYRISSFQIEQETNKLKNIIECASIGVHHEIKGNCIYLFIVLKDIEEDIETKVKNSIKNNIASYAVPERVIIIKELPKTRTGKIMRKVLKNIVENKLSSIDTTTLSNEYVIKDIINSLH